MPSCFCNKQVGVLVTTLPNGIKGFPQLHEMNFGKIFSEFVLEKKIYLAQVTQEETNDENEK